MSEQPGVIDGYRHLTPCFVDAEGTIREVANVQVSIPADDVPGPLLAEVHELLFPPLEVA